MTQASRFQRAIALLSLVALLGAWTPHVHSATETPGSIGHGAQHTTNSVSSDDHHHQHSSQAAIESEPCVACRSDAPDDKAVASQIDLRSEVADSNRIVAARSHTRLSIPDGLPLSRAPPAARLA